MNPNDFTTLAFLALGGEIQGKTKLQKSVFFLAVMTDCVRDLGFRDHFYGPYSDDVDCAVTWLKTIGAIDQNISSRENDPSGFEAKRYDFRLNEQGRQFAEKKSRLYSSSWSRLQQAAARLKDAGDIGYMEMSIAAKTYMMLVEKKRPATDNEVSRLAGQFGWDVSFEQIERAIEFLGRIGILQRNLADACV